MIGIFDSGLGGLTVLAQIKKLLPSSPIIYLADLAHLPYGPKSSRQIRQLSHANTEFLIGKGCQQIVIACNTASSYAFSYLKRTFPGIPIFDVITPTVEKAITVTKNNRIGIIGTLGTIQSRSYLAQIKTKQPKVKIFGVACPLLVPLIEENWQKKAETISILKYYLKPLKNQKIDTLILGCTHYPLLENQIRKILGPRVTLVNSATEVAKKVQKFFEDNKKIFCKFKANPAYSFYTTDMTLKINTQAKNFLGYRVRFKEVRLLLKCLS